MEKSKPNRSSNVWGKDLRAEEKDGTLRIYYTGDNGVEHFWEVPKDSEFEPPEWFVEGVSFEVWTKNRSTSRSFTDYDWVWVEPRKPRIGRR